MSEEKKIERNVERGTCLRLYILFLQREKIRQIYCAKQSRAKHDLWWIWIEQSSERIEYCALLSFDTVNCMRYHISLAAAAAASNTHPNVYDLFRNNVSFSHRIALAAWLRTFDEHKIYRTTNSMEFRILTSRLNHCVRLSDTM